MYRKEQVPAGQLSFGTDHQLLGIKISHIFLALEKEEHFQQKSLTLLSKGAKIFKIKIQQPPPIFDFSYPQPWSENSKWKIPETNNS